MNTQKKDCILYFANYRAGRGVSITTRGATGATFTEVNGASGGEHYVKFGQFKASETPTNATISMSTSGADFQVLQSFYILLTIA